MHLKDFGFSELVIGRHALSQANHAMALAKKGDETHLDAIRHLHTSEVGLSEEGVQQGIFKGLWLIEYQMTPFDFYATSKYKRAIETTHYMGLPDARWVQDARLNERDWGPMDQISKRERLERWPTSKENKNKDPFDWIPEAGGESIRDKTLHAHSLLLELQKLYPKKRGIIVAHGETSLGLQVCIERMSPERFNMREKVMYIQNATMIHYRQDENGTLFRRHINPLRDRVTAWKKIYREF